MNNRIGGNVNASNIDREQSSRFRKLHIIRDGYIRRFVIRLVG
ncbi:MAG: hypothetical protein ACYDDA_03880 [Acidiferrobacteraceae bacterium]